MGDGVTKTSTGHETRATKPNGAARFVWPPGRVEVKPSAHATGTPGAARADRSVPLPAPAHGALARWWRAIERTWLGVITQPVLVQAAEARWQPDAPAAYCPRCGESCGPFGADASGCGACRTKRLPWDRLVRLGTYEPPLRDWVRDVKFARLRPAGAALGRALAEQVRALPESRGVRFIVVPVPTSTWRRLVRAIDHPLVIARAVAGELDAPVWRALRRRHRAPQTALPRAQRARNVRGTMRMAGEGRWGRWGWLMARAGLVGGLPVSASTPNEVAHTVLLVVDDVTTTGETLTESCKALRRGLKRLGVAQVRVWTAVVAKTAVERPKP